MKDFQELGLNKHLYNAVQDLGFATPTPIQAKSYPVILSGKDIMGISQTGTGKTLAFMLPLLQELKFSKQLTPRILILVPTRELVVQIVEQIEIFTKYMTVRTLGVYGGANINSQKMEVREGVDIIVGTPGRIYDLALSTALSFKTIKKLVIDEVDVMLDLGFRFQLNNIFELLPAKRQNIMFSATKTEEIDIIIEDFFISPEKVSTAVSGTPLENIEQSYFTIENFKSKANLIRYFLQQKEVFNKVIIFTPSKKVADWLFEELDKNFRNQISVIHSNKSQNYRLQAVKDFDNGNSRVVITTDVLARGIDLDQISHVINFDTPEFPENYMHRIGRTGRAKQKGAAITLVNEKEIPFLDKIEALMGTKINQIDLPDSVELSEKITDLEKEPKEQLRNTGTSHKGPTNGSFHEKIDKNKKVNLGGSYHREIAQKYKKPKKRGDKIQNTKKNKKR